jgi:hypothetical protein
MAASVERRLNFDATLADQGALAPTPQPRSGGVRRPKAKPKPKPKPRPKPRR